MSSLSIQTLSSRDGDFQSQFKRALNRHQLTESKVDAQVAEIIQTVQEQGDQALIDYTERFDRYSVQQFSDLELSQDRLQQAATHISSEQFAALTHAAERIKRYHKHQLQASWEYTEADGSRLGQKVLPMQRAGLYVPGGKAAYPSSVLMTAIPAKVAGVGELVVAVPAPLGELNEMVLAAAYLAGVDRVFTLGGGQAIAALAYGTQTVPAVDTIVGPGNVYVALSLIHI